jgi:iron(III) transport system substrate-binding protein
VSSGTDYNTMSEADLAKAATDEGSLTWYTTFSSDDVNPMIAAFNKDYPNIKVNALRLSADQIPPKVITEQKGGQYTADVVSGDSPQIAQLIHANALQPYTPPSQTPLPAGLTLPKGYEGVVYAVTTAIAWNPTVVQKEGLPVPTGVASFTDPAWKGKFSIDPSAVNWYDSLIKIMGHDQALALVQKLGDNSPVFVESHTEALTDVQSGEPAGAATIYGYKASSMAQDTPDQVKFANPNPLPSSLNLIDVVKNAPHPAAARLFIDWMVSQDGQQEVVDQTNHTTLRSDVKNDPAVWDPTKWKPAWGDPMLSSDAYNTELAEFDKALHAPQ